MAQTAVGQLRNSHCSLAALGNYQTVDCYVVGYSIYTAERYDELH